MNLNKYRRYLIDNNYIHVSISDEEQTNFLYMYLNFQYDLYGTVIKFSVLVIRRYQTDGRVIDQSVASA